MSGLKKKGPTRKTAKRKKTAKLTAGSIMRGKAAKIRRSILPV